MGVSRATEPIASLAAPTDARCELEKRFALKTAPNAVTHPGITLLATYLPLGSLIAAAPKTDPEPGSFGEHLDQLRNYDPRREMVLFIASGDGDVLRTRCMHSESKALLHPPDAYRAERAARRNNARLS